MESRQSFSRFSLLLDVRSTPVHLLHHARPTQDPIDTNIMGCNTLTPPRGEQHFRTKITVPLRYTSHPHCLNKTNKLPTVHRHLRGAKAIRGHTVYTRKLYPWHPLGSTTPYNGWSGPCLYRSKDRSILYTTSPHNVLAAQLKHVEGMWQTTRGPYVLAGGAFVCRGERQATGALATYLEGRGVRYGVVHPDAL